MTNEREAELLEDYRRLTGDSPYQRWLLSKIGGCIGQRVLEVGTGVGGWTGRLTDRELLVSIDVSDYRLGIAEEALHGRHVVLKKMDICERESLELKRYRFDTILCVNTLEHIKDDRGALNNMAQILEAKGKLVLVAPALDFLFGSLDERYGHHRRYYKNELRDKVTGAGFELESIKYINMMGAIGWFIYAKALRLDRPPLGSFDLFNRLLPVYSFVDEAIGPPLGLSLIAVGNKP